MWNSTRKNPWMWNNFTKKGALILAIPKVTPTKFAQNEHLWRTKFLCSGLKYFSLYSLFPFLNLKQWKMLFEKQKIYQFSNRFILFNCIHKFISQRWTLMCLFFYNKCRIHLSFSKIQLWFVYILRSNNTKMYGGMHPKQS